MRKKTTALCLSRCKDFSRVTTPPPPSPTDGVVVIVVTGDCVFVGHRGVQREIRRLREKSVCLSRNSHTH